MSRIFMTGLEAGHLGVFSTYENHPVVTTTAPRTGARSLLLDFVADTVTIAIWPTRNELFMRLGVRYISEGARDPSAFLSFMDGVSSQVTFTVPQGTVTPIQARVGDPRQPIVAAGGSLSLNAWTCLEIHVLISLGGRIALKVNGIQVINYTGTTRATTLDRITDIRIGHILGGIWSFHMDAQYDDIVINDTGGSYNNSWPGRGGIYLAQPSAAGAYSEFTPNANANWQQVREVPPDEDTSFVQGATLGARDLYTTGGIAVPDGTITATQWVNRSRLQDVGVGNLQPLVRHGGVDYLGPLLGVDQAYRYNFHIMDRAPDDTEWTLAKANSLQIGQQVG